MSGRLTRAEAFRARVWRDMHRRADVKALSNRAHRLLVGIVHEVLTPYNNGAINLGPATMAKLGLTSNANAEAARAELVQTNLLQVMTEGRRGARTCYALPFLPFALDPRNNLPTGGEVDIPAGGEVPPLNLPTGGEDFPMGGEVF